MNTSERQDPLDSILAQIGEEIAGKALIQYVDDDTRQTRHWGLLLVTESAVHVVYGRTKNWFSRAFGDGTPEHTIISVPRTAITGVDLPPRRGFRQRMLYGRTGPATIHRALGSDLVLDVDQDAIALLESL